ncbi:hypothetical protein ONZ45_g16632 [Pleurotus djamor]|nr:hypothetical protein ONZ45_g16632 [Pleurotus djamor]
MSASESTQSVPQSSTSSTLQRWTTFGKSKKPAVVFPPPSWGLEEEVTPPPEQQQSRTSTPLPAADDAIPPPPEPATIAQTIRSLVSSLPPIPSSSKGTQTPASTQVDPKGPPVLENLDAKLMAWLSSEAVMNGYYAGKDSVFSALDRLKRPLKKDGESTSGSGGGGQTSQEAAETTDRVGVDGVMMYTPLIPTSDSQVELADEDPELEYVDPEDLVPKPTGSEAQAGSSSAEAGPSSSKTKSRLHRLFGWNKANANETPESKPQKLEKTTVPKHVWVPSETNISVQVMWWGYRIYLPPPVMASLDNGSIVATKRAAMIATALKWMLDKIPTMMVPPALRPALALFKRLAPFAGYIGVVIAWSWKSIKANDVGGGVTLTATWLLTAALIPSPWEVTPERHLVEPKPKPGTTATQTEAPKK